jgi:hypothetical protein
MDHGGHMDMPRRCSMNMCVIVCQLPTSPLAKLTVDGKFAQALELSDRGYLYHLPLVAYYGWIHVLYLIHDNCLAWYHLRMATKASASARHTDSAASHQEKFRSSGFRQPGDAVARSCS